MYENDDSYQLSSKSPLFEKGRHFSAKASNLGFEVKNKDRSLTNYAHNYNYESFGHSNKKYRHRGEEEMKVYLELKKIKTIRRQLRMYYFKDYLILLTLLLSPSFNFSYLYLPYILIGMLYIVIGESLSKCAMKTKYLTEIFTIGYSSYLLVFKGVMIALIKSKKEIEVEIKEYQALLLDLGVILLKDTNSVYYLVCTFISEAIVIVISGFSIFTSFHCRLLSPKDAEEKIVTNIKLRKYIIIIYFFIIGFTMYNLSYLNLIYILAIQFVFLITSLKYSDDYVKKVLKNVIYLLSLLIFLQIIATNFLNIPSIQLELSLLYDSNGLKNGDKIYSVFKRIGINHDDYDDILDILKKFAGYFFAIISLIMLVNSIKKLKSEEAKLENNQYLKSPKPAKSNVVVSGILFFLSHPVFNFEMSRVLAILWTYHYRNYYSLGMLFFIIISFFAVHTKSNKNLILWVLTPMLTLTLISFHLSNIEGICEDIKGDQRLKYLRFAIGKYDHHHIEYLIGHVFFTNVMFCLNSMFSKQDEGKPIKPNSKKKENIMKLQTYNPLKEIEKLNEEILPKSDSNDEKSGEEIVFESKNSINEAEPETDFLSEARGVKENVTHKNTKNCFIQRKNNILSNPNKNVEFGKLVMKGLLMHIDKITLVVMYLVSIYNVNLIHVVLVFIFIIQIISPGKINYCYKFNAFLFQLLYLIEFIIDLLKIYYIEQFKKYKAFFDFLIVYKDDISSNDLELCIYGVIYCFYFQYRTYNIESIKSVLNSKHITVRNYVENKCHDKPKAQEILLIIGGITNHIYLWGLISLFVFFNCYFEISFIFGIKLAIFFVCCFIFIYSIQLPLEDINTACLKIFNRFFLFVCCINTLVVYLYQFINKDFLGLKEYVIINDDLYPDFYLKNLPNIGFTIYKDDHLYINFLPHFMTTFIAVLFIWETESILNEMLGSSNTRRTTVSHLLVMQKNKKKQEQERIERIKAEENEFVQDKLYSDKYDENDDNIASKSTQLLKIYVILFFTKCYWLALFFSFGIIFANYDLSFSMLIYILIFGLLTNKMFHRIISRLKKYIKKKSYYISKVIRFCIVEKPKHYEITKYYRLLTFRCLLFFSFLYYLSTYFYGVFDLFQHGCNPSLFNGCDPSHLNIVPVDEDDSTDHDNLEAKIKSYAFLFGIYYDVRKESIFRITLAHLILTGLICFDVYNQKIEEHYHNLCETLQQEVQKLVNENNVLQKYSDIADLNILIQIGLSIAGIDLSPQKNGRKGSRVSLKEQFMQNNEEGDNNTKSQQEINNPAQIIEENDEGEEDEDYENRGSKKLSGKPSEILEGLKEDEPKDNAIELYDLNENAPYNSFLKNKGIRKFIEMFKSSNDNETQLTIGNSRDRVVRFIKKFVEELIIFVLLCIALAKLNLLTFLYLIVTFILIATKKTMWKFFVLSCFIYISLITQCISFVTNISQKTSERDNEAIFDVLDKTLGFPWYRNYFDEKKGFFYGLGVCKAQARSIWWEFAQIIIIYIYLDFFPYSKYQDIKNLGEKETQCGDQRFDIETLNMNPQSIGRLTKMTEMEFMQYKACLESFDLNIGESIKDFFQFLKLSPKYGEKTTLVLEHKPNLNLSAIKNDVLRDLIYVRMYNKEMRNNLEKQDLKQYKPFPQYMLILQEILYMYLHCFLIITIIIISIMIAGILSTIYFSVCFYYLIKSDSLYLGQEYSYPKALKRYLRIIVLIDITMQGIYQLQIEEIAKMNSTLSKFFISLGLIQTVKYDEIDKQISTFQTVELFGKPLMYFFMSIQCLIYESRNFKRYYLVYLLEHKQELNKISLINSFTYNNSRVKMYEKSLNIRQQTDQAMADLKQIIIELNDKLSQVGKKLFTKKETVKNFSTRKSKKNGEFNTENNIENNIVDKGGSQNSLLKISQAFGRPKEEKKEKREKHEYLPAEDVKNKIKEIVYSGFMTQMYLWFHSHSATYKSIESSAKYDYEIQTIKGETKIESLIESDINRALSILNLENIDKSDMLAIETILESCFSKEKKHFLEEEKQRELRSQSNINKFKKFGSNMLKLVKLQRAMYGDLKIANNPNEIENQNKRKDLLEKYKIQMEKEREEREQKEKEKEKRRKKLAQFEELLDTKLFKKYLKRSYQIRHIIIYLQSFCINNFSWFCYFLMILDHMTSGSMVTLVYPLSIFCYAILEYPRPKKSFWLISLYFSLIILCGKFIIQFKGIIAWMEQDTYSDLVKFLDDYSIGFKFHTTTFSSDFLFYIIFDALVVLSILINRNLLISDGLWFKREDEIENIYEASERIAIYKNKKHENLIQAYKDLPMRYFYSQKEIARKGYRKNRSGIRYKFSFFSNKAKDPQYDEANKSYYDKLFTEVRNEKPGNDYYVGYTIALFLVCFYILLFFTQMDQDKTYGAVDLDTTQFSGAMVIYLIFHILILIFDRIIFVLQNREDIHYEYIFYRRNEKNFQGELISEQELNALKSEIVKNNMNNKFHNIPVKDLEKLKRNYNIIFIQNEQFNKPLLNKYILHIFTTIFSHLVIFIYFPIMGNINLGNGPFCENTTNECNDFNDNNYIVFFYIFYLIYLFLSGLQVRTGFYDIKRKSIFKRGNDEMVSGISNVFHSIPFLYEIKNAIDWTFTSTCLDLFQWNKFEAIYDTIFDTYCDKSDWDERPIGRRVSSKKKFSIGGTLSFVLIFILVIPLILFSSLNPTNELNNLRAAKIQVDLSFTYKNQATKKYNLFHNERADSISDMFVNGKSEVWRDYSYDLSVQTRNFNHDQVQRIIFSETSDTNWDLANPHILNLIKLLDLNQTNDLAYIEILLEYELSRPKPAEAQTCSNHFNVTIYDTEIDNSTSARGKKIEDLRFALENCSAIHITIENAYTAPLRLTSAAEVNPIEDEKYFTPKDIEIGFEGCVKENNEPNYFKSYYTLHSKEGNETKPLELHAFSDQISETTQGYSVLTFYISFVLLAGTYIRDFLANEPEKIMLGEMPHSKKIVDLCEGIKIARYSYDFKNEEYLYTILIELMRSPDYLKVITDSSLDHFRQREELNNKDD